MSYFTRSHLGVAVLLSCDALGKSFLSQSIDRWTLDPPSRPGLCLCCWPLLQKLQLWFSAACCCSPQPLLWLGLVLQVAGVFPSESCNTLANTPRSEAQGTFHSHQTRRSSVLSVLVLQRTRTWRPLSETEFCLPWVAITPQVVRLPGRQQFGPHRDGRKSYHRPCCKMETIFILSMAASDHSEMVNF